jgi:hypothetical protein
MPLHLSLLLNYGLVSLSLVGQVSGLISRQQFRHVIIAEFLFATAAASIGTQQLDKF